MNHSIGRFGRASVLAIAIGLIAAPIAFAQTTQTTTTDKVENSDGSIDTKTTVTTEPTVKQEDEATSTTTTTIVQPNASGGTDTYSTTKTN